MNSLGSEEIDQNRILDKKLIINSSQLDYLIEEEKQLISRDLESFQNYKTKGQFKKRFKSDKRIAEITVPRREMASKVEMLETEKRHLQQALKGNDLIQAVDADSKINALDKNNNLIKSSKDQNTDMNCLDHSKEDNCKEDNHKADNHQDNHHDLTKKIIENKNAKTILTNQTSVSTNQTKRTIELDMNNNEIKKLKKEDAINDLVRLNRNQGVIGKLVIKSLPVLSFIVNDYKIINPIDKSMIEMKSQSIESAELNLKTKNRLKSLKNLKSSKEQSNDEGIKIKKANYLNSTLANKKNEVKVSNDSSSNSSNSSKSSRAVIKEESVRSLNDSEQHKLIMAVKERENGNHSNKTRCAEAINKEDLFTKSSSTGLITTIVSPSHQNHQQKTDKSQTKRSNNSTKLCASKLNNQANKQELNVRTFKQQQQQHKLTNDLNLTNLNQLNKLNNRIDSNRLSKMDEANDTNKDNHSNLKVNTDQQTSKLNEQQANSSNNSTDSPDKQQSPVDENTWSNLREDYELGEVIGKIFFFFFF